ncbi:sensor histidine kinase [Streptosporangium lutulentum]
MLDNGRRRAVTEAKRAQRLILARDLHDFVAHDVSGILVQAQAAQLAPGPLPAQVTDALRRIEAAGLRALAAMDRTVQMLHEADETRSGAGEPLPGVDGLARLVDGYSPSVRVDLSVEPGLERRLSQETSATVYRVVTEALTNVRRHAWRRPPSGSPSLAWRSRSAYGSPTTAAATRRRPGAEASAWSGSPSGSGYSAARCRPGRSRVAGGSRRSCPPTPTGDLGTPGRA